MATPHVLIAGAGLGGLTFAQALKKQGISFHVYERDSANSFRAQGYRIRIHGEGTAALRQCLPEQIWELFEKTCAEAPTSGPMAQVDPTTGEPPVAKPGGRGPPMFKDPRTVDRRVVREVLQVGIEDKISWGKEIVRYETDNQSSVTIYFKDGSSEAGTLLVGAEGVHSPTRKQYLPDLLPKDTGTRAFFGKTPLTEQFLSTYPNHLLKGMGKIRDADTTVPSHSLVEATRFPPKDQRPAHPVLPADYVYWVSCAQLDKLSQASVNFPPPSNEAAASLWTELHQHWAPNMRSLFELQDPTQTSVLAIRSMDPDIPTWQPSPTVTLLGDAVHVMPPTGASGAVTALRDAALLSRLIAEKGVSKESIGEYEAQMRVYAGETIRMSVGAAGMAFGFSDPATWKVATDV
ncbi:hypothetical protein ANO11243_078320 [Dothideomycetidae sp. 11243]|nr:hypothetical protein ANO11243_078320 [fungal sp. No.11243]